MAKIYLEKNVYEAAKERIAYAFEHFDNVLVSCSGGKDSCVMVQITNDIAKELNREFYVMFLDQECISGYTVETINKLKGLSNIKAFYHICLPFEEDNAVSVFSPQWTMWDEEKKDIWVREIPEDAININNNPFEFFYKNMADLEFYPLFSKWLAGEGSLANLIGLRANESLNRFRAVTKDSIGRFNNKNYTVVQDEKVVKFYPIFDWETSDVWKCTFQNNYIYNEIYELMTKAGVKFSDQRICQPFGLEQRQGLDLFAKFEPDLWDKMVNRVSGANFGALYARTEMLGHLKTSKPKHMSWEQYTIFLLESIQMEYPEIVEQYAEKIRTTLKYHKEHYNQLPTDDKVENSKEYISWKEIARAVEKNDFWMKRLSFAETKRGYDRLEKIKQKYFDIL